MLEGRLARARRAVRTRSRLTKYTEQDYGSIATTRFSYFTIATRNYWHALIFATVRTWKISKIPPKSARTELPGHIKISILTKCGVRVVYPETVTYMVTPYSVVAWLVFRRLTSDLFLSKFSTIAQLATPSAMCPCRMTTNLHVRSDQSEPDQIRAS